MTVGQTAGEGGAWGIAVLAAYLEAAPDQDLSTFLGTHVFAGAVAETVEPDAADVRGFDTYLERYSAGLAIERAAVGAV